ncbi:hypothetical protein X777_00181 [Ooceraea biroi]|uniref:Uncharacterized protein n=1 Tax=Ooceraea biroi TaxID=2015173 RepID=A0A026VRQ9_OOCBI|nr:hypothetical protein X777_00181 [Ooceraea biroi]
MNLNKTEKLLAAKRKLKEFQLQKRLHAQEHSSKQNTNAKNESISQCQTNCQVTEVDKSCDQNNQYETMHTENSIQPENQLNDVNVVHKEENILNHAFSDTSNSIDAITTKVATNNSKITEKNFSILENNRDGAVSHKNGDNDTRSYLQPNLQSIENDGRCNLNITPSNGPSTVPREHLSETAEGAKVLKDDVDDCKPTDLDLKYNNQFLSTCVEEQKQIVNDLYVQLNHYVGII